MTTDAATRVQALIDVVQAITQVIREVKVIPSGHLYATLMANGCNLETYNKLVSILLESGRVVKRGDLLVWVETPEEEEDRSQKENDYHHEVPQNGITSDMYAN